MEATNGKENSPPATTEGARRSSRKSSVNISVAKVLSDATNTRRAYVFSKDGKKVHAAAVNKQKVFT